MSEPVIVTVPLSAEAVAALDAWIARTGGTPTRAQAIARLLAGVLGSDAPSSVIPGLVTGRDIV